MQLTPIFDQLVEEFVKKDIHILGLYEKTPPTITIESVRDGISFLANLGEVLAQDEVDDAPTVVIEAVEESSAVTHKTLYDATKLAVIKPAIPEMVKLPHQAVKSVTETRKEADEELGLDNFDEAFAVAAKVLERHPTHILEVPAKATPAMVVAIKKEVSDKGYDFKVEQALPKRKNNRNKNRNLNRARSTS